MFGIHNIKIITFIAVLLLILTFAIISCNLHVKYYFFWALACSAIIYLAIYCFPIEKININGGGGDGGGGKNLENIIPYLLGASSLLFSGKTEVGSEIINKLLPS